MKVPFGTLTVTKKAKKLINNALKTGKLTSGRLVRDFEEKFAKIIGTKYAIAVSSGTDAVALSLAVLYDFGAKRGDEIITPALSFVATGNAVLQAGFIPKFVDIKRETLNIDEDQIEKAITEKTRAILVVHLMGKPANMTKILEIAKKYKLFVIEDSAEAHGGTYYGKTLGSIGDIGAFSLYAAHIISTIEGGIITTNREDFKEILISLRNHGRACKCDICVLNIGSTYCEKRFSLSDHTDIRFMFERIGFSAKMNELEAGFGLGNIEIYEKILKKRRRNLYYLIKNFKKFDPYLKTINKEKYEEIGPHAFPIIVNEKLANFTRNEIAEYLEKNGIETRTLFQSMPTQCPGFKFLGYKLGQFPNAEYIGKNGIHIGVHQDIGIKECKYVIETITSFLDKTI